MTTASHPLQPLTLADILQDLESGRSLPLRPQGRLTNLTSLHRPTLGGRSFLRTYMSARAFGRIHPRLARRSLMRLWFTPWVHPSALNPVEDLPGDFTAWSLETDGPTLTGYAGGTGPVVVLVHGWAGRAADWRHLAADLIGAGWRVVVPDLPAHGMTPGRRTDLFELGRAVSAVIDHERPVAIVTHSMGFPATMLALEDGGHRPDALVALAPGRRIAHALDGFARRAALPAELVEELRRALEQRFGADIWHVLDVDRVLPLLKAEGLVIHDVDDREVPLSDARHIAAGWPGAELVTTEGLGHRRILRDGTVRSQVLDALP
jgi:pimeloyl-ACP methyl ester carboxylesterase